MLKCSGKFRSFLRLNLGIAEKSELKTRLWRRDSLRRCERQRDSLRECRGGAELHGRVDVAAKIRLNLIPAVLGESPQPKDAEYQYERRDPRQNLFCASLSHCPVPISRGQTHTSQN